MPALRALRGYDAFCRAVRWSCDHLRYQPEQVDRWRGPLATLRQVAAEGLGKADCDEHAILTAYIVCRDAARAEVSFDPGQPRIVIGRMKSTGGGHMRPGYVEGLPGIGTEWWGEPQTGRVWRADTRGDWVPLHSWPCVWVRAPAGKHYMQVDLSPASRRDYARA